MYIYIYIYSPKITSKMKRISATGGVLSKKKFLKKPATLLKKGTLAQVFSCEFCEISKNTFLTEHLRTT